MELDLQTIQTLIDIMEAHGLTELEVEEGGSKVRLAKAAPGAVLTAPGQFASAAALPAAAPAPLDPPAREEGLVEFTAPMVGTFYRAPAPGAPVFVDAGDEVHDDSVLCIIEAMKVMNEIKAELKGEVREVLVANGEAVEFGQPLFLIKKA